MILIPVCHVTVKEMGHKKYLGSLYKVCTVHVHVYVPTQTPGGGVLGYKHDGGVGGPTEPNILHPKKYMDLILCTQKNTRLEIF